MITTRVNAVLLGYAIVSLALWSGCASGPDDDGPPRTATTVAAATGPATVTTDAVSYNFATPVVVSWSGLGGNLTDWVALAPAGSPLTTTTRWAYTNSIATNGSMTLEGPVPGGSYVARAFDNNTFTLMGESDPVAVADVSDTHATLTLDQADYHYCVRR